MLVSQRRILDTDMEKKSLAVLIAILAFGSFMRFYNLNWDQGYIFHPDERNIAAAVSRIRFFNQLNPKFFAYGGFSIYLYRAIGEALNWITSKRTWVYEWGQINLVGRSVSAFASSLSLIFVFLLGRKVFERRVGLLAAFFAAFCVSLIQTAHYGVTESLLCFWGPLIALLSLRLLERPTLGSYLFLGAVSGLAIGTKISAASFLIFPCLAHLLLGRKDFWRRGGFLLLFGLSTVLFFLLSSPYTVLDFEKFKESMEYEGGVVSGRLKVCYVYQFLKTTPYLFQVRNLPWLMGPLLAFFSLVGLIALIVKILREAFRRRILKEEIILVGWPLAYFAIVGSWFAKFVRYMAPLLPFFCLFAAWIVVEIKKRWRFAGSSLIFISTASTSLYALSFMSIYAHASTRLAASRWIYQHIPQGSRILKEHWDDGLPVSLGGASPDRYEFGILEIYEPDNDEKLKHYAKNLAAADYMVINSRRLYGTMLHLTERYPLTSRYYKLLFAGKLGYRKIAEFTSYPRLLGLEIKTAAAEETFQVYDHPKVMVFQNQKRFDEGTLIRILSK